MYAPGYDTIVPPMVSVFNKQIGWMGENWADATPSSALWGSSSRAIYQPVLIPAVCVVRRVWWANGSTVSGAINVDCGVYADAGYKPGARLISCGLTAQGTASQVQFADVTDTALPPGLYWIALSLSGSSETIFGFNASASWDAAGHFTQSSANPLPATATPVESNTVNIYLFGFATTASP